MVRQSYDNGGYIKNQEHSRKSAINDLNDFFGDKINPCYENLNQIC